MTLKQLEDEIAEIRKRGAEDHTPVFVDEQERPLAFLKYTGVVVIK